MSADQDAALLALERCHQRLAVKAAEYRELAGLRAERIRDAHRLGLSWGQLASALGVSRSAVSRFASAPAAGATLGGGDGAEVRASEVHNLPGDVSGSIF